MAIIDALKTLPLGRQLWNFTRDEWVTLSSLLQDRWYGVDTHVPLTSLINRDPRIDDEGYEPLRYAAIRSVLRHLQPVPGDIFYDVGCGKGRVLSLFARHRLCRCVGIEHEPTLAAAAVANCARVRGKKSTIDIRVEDAANSDYRDATIILFYQPFGWRRMEICLDRIRETLTSNPRRVRVVFVGDDRLVLSMLRNCHWLRASRTFEVPFWVRANMPAMVLESVLERHEQGPRQQGAEEVPTIVDRG